MGIRTGILAVLAAAMFAACNTPPPAPTIDPERAAEQNSRVGATGIVIPPEHATLSFLAAGEIVALNVAAGDVVEEGDILAQLDTTLLDYDVAEAEASVEIAEANLEKS